MFYNADMKRDFQTGIFPSKEDLDLDTLLESSYAI